MTNPVLNTLSLTPYTPIHPHSQCWWSDLLLSLHTHTHLTHHHITSHHITPIFSHLFHRTYLTYLFAGANAGPNNGSGLTSSMHRVGHTLTARAAQGIHPPTHPPLT